MKTFDNKLCMEKQDNISYLRICATICVIWLHTCSTLSENRQMFFLTDLQYIFYNVAYQIMYWAVPVFFMITGALMLGKKTSYRQCFIKYVRRVIFALIIFGIPFSALKLLMQTKRISFNILSESIKAVIENKGFGHLWYLYVLIGIYLVLPFLQNAVSKMALQQLRYLLISLYVVDFIFPIISIITNINIAFSIPFSYPIFYVLNGYYLVKKNGYIKRRKLIGYMLVIVCIIIVTNYIEFYPIELSSYNSPLIVILSMCIFELFRTIKKESTKIIWKIDRMCFGVYLIHPFFIQFVYRFLKITPAIFKYYYLWTFIFFIFFVLCSFLISLCMSKIKLLKTYVL